MSETNDSKNGNIPGLIVAEQHVENVGETALSMYENRNVVRELASRMIMLHPAAAEVGNRAMMEAAQLALMIGASPLPATNEIHIYPANGKVIVQPGINYWQRRALF